MCKKPYDINNSLKQSDKRTEHISAVESFDHLHPRQIYKYIHFSSSNFVCEDIDTDIDIEEAVDMHDIPGPSKPTRSKQNIITPHLAIVLDECKIRDRDAVHLLTAVAECFQVNCSEFEINMTSIKKARDKHRKQ